MSKIAINLALTALVLLGGYRIVSARGIPSFAGPITVVVQQIEPCPPEMLGKNLHSIHGLIKQTRERPLPRWYGYFEDKEPLDDSVEMHGAVASWSRVGGWKPNAFRMPFKRLCTTLRTFFKDMTETVEKYNPEGMKFCPRLPGNFTVDGFPFRFSPNKVLTFPYGRWRADFSYFHKNELVGCSRFFADTVPRMDNKTQRSM